MRGLVADVVRSSYVDGPGNRYVVFLQGCTFDCVGCHNPHTITTRPTPTSRWMSVDEVAADIARVAPFLSGVTVSGGEATRQWEFVLALFERLSLDRDTSRLTRLVDTNGDAPEEVWDALARSMHGAMVDLKALDPEVHRRLTRSGNERVLASIRHLNRLWRLDEVRLLVVPGVNDSSAQLAATAEWLGELDPIPAITVQGFRHHGTRRAARSWAEASRGHVEEVADVLVGHGLARSAVRVRAPQEDLAAVAG